MTRSPGRLKEQVQETVRDIPVQAARLALFGAGRALLLTDRMRKDYKEARESGLRPVFKRWRDDAGHLAGKVVGKVTERVSGTGQEPAPESEMPMDRPPGPQPNPSPAAEPAPAPDRVTKLTAEPDPTPAPDPAPALAPDRVTKLTPEPEPAPTPDRVTKIAADSLPVPDYDDATLASVRARLRSLTAVQVSQLRDYEQANAARAEFLKMYENRIAKLTAGA